MSSCLHSLFSFDIAFFKISSAPPPPPVILCDFQILLLLQRLGCLCMINVVSMGFGNITSPLDLMPLNRSSIKQVIFSFSNPNQPLAFQGPRKKNTNNTKAEAELHGKEPHLTCTAKASKCCFLFFFLLLLILFLGLILEFCLQCHFCRQLENLTFNLADFHQKTWITLEELLRWVSGLEFFSFSFSIFLRNLVMVSEGGMRCIEKALWSLVTQHKLLKPWQAPLY